MHVIFNPNQEPKGLGNLCLNRLIFKRCVKAELLQLKLPWEFLLVKSLKSKNIRPLLLY